jgi:maleylacetoacetate isomerase
MPLVLYSYFRSSAAYRVRIALNLKSLPYDMRPVSLVRDGGEQHKPEYRAVNPAGLVPSLVTAEGQVITQSLAIMEYLDECFPEPSLMPGSAVDRARVRAIAQAMACDIHPVNNLRILRYLEHELSVAAPERNAWYRHWVTTGLAAVEAMVTAAGNGGTFCVGDRPTLADCCLVPQLFNARRFGCELDTFPNLLRIESVCQQLEAFRHAAPERQPDAV